VDPKEILKQVKDPEIGQNIVDLGLIYRVDMEGKHAKILMTLTTPMCPAGGFIMNEVERVLTENGLTSEIELTFEPPWSPDMIDKNLRRKLGI